MTSPLQTFEIFLMTAPGLEQALCEEARDIGFLNPKPMPGGVVFRGGWPHVWRANLKLRGAARVTAHIGAFRALHLSELDKQARKVAWGDVLRKDRAFRVEATSRKSRIYHSDAASERIARAITQELGATLADDARVCIRARIENDIVSLSVDTSGELLHKRGHKEQVAKAPMRENMAAMFLRQCGYAGRESVLDPMCGSGTFVIEAAEIALGHFPGRARSFAFEELATFDARAWEEMRDGAKPRELAPDVHFYGSDADAGAVRMSGANAERAGIGGVASFLQRDVADLERPDGPPGLVIVNPPYGNRIGDKGRIAALYRALGKSLRRSFRGWRVGLITSHDNLARATGLPFLPPGPPVLHGGLRVRLYRTAAL